MKMSIISMFLVLTLVSLCNSQIKNRDVVIVAPNEMPVQLKNTNVPQQNAMKSSKNATAIALEYCEKYDQYKYVDKFTSSSLPGIPGTWYKDMECRAAETLMIPPLHSYPQEFPHMALIGYGNSLKTVEWNCVGSLISEKFILSSAHCSSISRYGAPKWVLLGDLNTASNEDAAKPAIYEIVKIYSNHKNLALFKLNVTVTMSPYVRPTCLHTSTFHQNGTLGEIVGWGQTRPGGQRSDYLLKRGIKTIDDGECKTKFKWYNSTTMICAKFYDSHENECVGDSGSPFLLKHTKKSCMWNLLGVMIDDAETCIDDVPRVLINVAFYLDWIQRIVWP